MSTDPSKVLVRTLIRFIRFRLDWQRTGLATRGDTYPKLHKPARRGAKRLTRVLCEVETHDVTVDKQQANATTLAQA